MTTTRDAIGLSERLRHVHRVFSRAHTRQITMTVWSSDVETLEEAATALDALLKERDALRHILSDCATAIGNGAMVSPECSLEFMSNLPEEIAAHTDALQARVKEYQSLAKELSDALLTVRPLGGSELFVRRFGQHYADPVYCKAAIEQSHKDRHEAQKGLIRYRRQAEAAESRATSAEQERDEAYERAAKVAEGLQCRNCNSVVPSGDGIGLCCGRPDYDSISDVSDAIRRLADGTKKEGNNA